MIKLERLLTGLAMAEDESRNAHMTIQRYGKPVVSHLYLVTLTRKVPDQHPIVSQYHVIAPDEEEATEQVKKNAFPTTGCALTDEQEDMLTASAFQIPVHIRGWGRDTF